MGSEFIFRSSMFGGFNKFDVINYIDSLQNDLAAVNNQLIGMDKMFRGQTEQLKKIPELEAELANKTKVFEENEALTKKIAELENKMAKSSEEYEKIKSAEAQLGAAFVDARRYSEKIISAARDRASDVSKDASEDITSKAIQIRAVADDADKIAIDFSKKMEALTQSISALSSKMSAVAMNLVKTEAKTDFQPRVDFDELEALGLKDADDVIAITKDEETGMTFVSYAPNTDFNDDLILDIELDEANEA